MEPFMAYGLTTVLLALFFVVFFKLLRIVPEQEAWIVENFGKFRATLGPGFHLVIPVIQKIAYKQIIKEEVIDVPPQVCITRDNVQVQVDGLLYLRVVDPVKAAYGIDNYRFAAAQLAQTTMRSEIGKIELDNTFSERDLINSSVVKAVDEASDPWGIKVTRYEIRDITPTDTILKAMEQQVRAEREKRAEILTSEGERDSRINLSKGERSEAINLSKGERQKRINFSEGKAQAIEIIAAATAEGLETIAQAVNRPMGKKALSMRIADQFIEQLGEILSTADTSVMPHDLANIRGLLQSVLPSGSDTETEKSLQAVLDSRPQTATGGKS
ncbi:SPFH domain-containing protein [Spirochaeta africana]|uniref:Membrane protease subunit, stomatin/prohibitin n=1 Tax=Spirochaeta africana (strain ATCC 700263 / DSM 8902 / Z-7692) TaxID=889378 RepID=H9UMV2_SPIAZ|nr:paraslipin [Spirochaeta africana]AFG38845.1 membrane protease subunit, stomatin/prohibitin [Spirochaeta africana DSM 8902]